MSFLNFFFFAVVSLAMVGVIGAIFLLSRGGNR